MLDKLRQHPIASSNFRCFWLGQFVSTFGDSLTGMAMTWLLMGLTDSTLSRGITLALGVLPSLLLTPLAGSVIDRFSRRRMLIISDLARLTVDLLMVFVLLTKTVAVWHIYAFSLLHALARVFHRPCLMAFLPSLVTREQLPQANSAQDLAMRLAMLFGPLAGGVAFAKLGATVVIGFDALTFLISAFFLYLVRVQEEIQPAGQRATMREQLSSGWAYVRQNNWIIYLTSAMLLVNMASMVFGIVWPLIIKNQLHFGPEQHGFLNSVSSFASIASAMLLTSFMLRLDKKKTLITSLAAGGLCRLALAYVSNLYVIVFFIGAIGITYPPLSVANNSIYQAEVPSEYMGRVSVFRTFMAQSLTPIVSLAAGAFGDMVSYNTLIFLSAALMLAAASLVYFKVNVVESADEAAQAA